MDAILEAEACIDADPLAYTEFNPVQIRAVRAFTVDGAKMILMVKPNGVGGTFVLAALMAAVQWPTFNPLFAAPIFTSWPYKKQLRFISTTQMVGDGDPFQVAVRELWPKGRYTQRRGTGKGYFSHITSDTGFDTDVLTYNQHPQEHAGSTKGAIFASEPPPKPILSENLARLRAGGKFFGEFTPLSYAAYVKDEYVDKGGLYLKNKETGKLDKVGKIEVVTGDIEENCADHTPGGQLPHREIESTVASWPIEEREARLTGGFMHLAGRIYTQFSRENGNLIQELHPYHQELYNAGRFNLVHTLDPHDRKPWAAGWHGIFPNDDRITISELPSDLLFHEVSSAPAEWDVEWYRESILETERALFEALGLKLPVDRWIDPNFGNSPKLGSVTVKQLLAGPCEKCSGEGNPAKRSALKVPCAHRLVYQDAPNSIPQGHTIVRGAIGCAKEGKRAKYMVLEPYCPNHAYAMAHYGYKEEKRPDERGPSEDPQLVHKDYPDGVRYMYLAVPGFKEPSAPIMAKRLHVRRGGRGA